MKVLDSIFVTLSVCAASFAQSAPARPEFEVASVKVAAPGVAGQIPVGLHIDGSQVSFRYLSLQDYMGTAYDIKKHQIVGPDWLATERYDIQAKMPAGVEQDKLRGNMREMMQVLLEDRFKLKFHRETKELPVYALVAAKGGVKMKEAPADAQAEEASRKAVDV